MKQYIPILVIGAALLGSGCSETMDPNSSEQPSVEAPEEFECTNGMSDDIYPCENIDMLAHVSTEELMGEPLESGLVVNDVWGWTDPKTEKEYVLVGLNDGVTFVDISTPTEPVVVGKLNEPEVVAQSRDTEAVPQLLHDEGKSSWRDLRVFENHLYVVSDGQSHGLQVFNLTQLRNINNPPEIFSEDVHYTQFGNAHNIAINNETGFAYVVGSDTYGGGLHIIDISTPQDPKFAGFHSDSTVGFDQTGYVHDTQCVNYQGPDANYQGDQICINSSETHLVIADVTNKQFTNTIGKATYQNVGYAHQGWLTEDHRYFLLDDEFDENQTGSNTRTYIWDLQDLENPELIGTYEDETTSIDHNQYVKGDYVYQSNYTSGLRILSLENIEDGQLSETAYFDTFPENNTVNFDGSWSNYPFFESGVVAVADISNGLYVLYPQLEGN